MVTFEYQKHDDDFIQKRTHDHLIFPFRQWSVLVQHLLGYPGMTRDMQVQMIIMAGKPILFTAKTVLAKLRAAIFNIDKDILEFEASESGLHSLRSVAAISVYLNNIPVYTIILIIF
jgi:hypothetical protein